MKRQKDCRMSCDIGKAAEGLENELWRKWRDGKLQSSFSNPSVALPTSQLILQPFRCFTYVTAHSPTLLSLLLRHRLFTYVTWRAAHDRYGRCCCLVLRHSLTSQVISVAFYIEREKSDKFCSEALISAVNLRDGTNGFTSLPKEVILRIFTLWKNPSTPAGFEPASLWSSGEYDNHGTTGVDSAIS